MLPPPLQNLVDFHAPLSTLQREQGGAVTLLTPGVNVLALNATFLPDDLAGIGLGAVDLDAVRDWHESQGVPVLVATANPLPGAREVARLQLGTWAPAPGSPPSGVVVEQVSRLNLSAWAKVVTAAHATPDWSEAVARHLAGRLEGDRASVLLMAYRSGSAVGALLWREGAAHLWGAFDAQAAEALLNPAFDLGASLQVTVPSGLDIRLTHSQTVIYSLLD